MVTALALALALAGMAAIVLGMLFITWTLFGHPRDLLENGPSLRRLFRSVLPPQIHPRSTKIGWIGGSPLPPAGAPGRSRPRRDEMASRTKRALRP
jgi:hypothetical protein